jgi:DNA-binding transcriptional LysR family regulator
MRLESVRDLKLEIAVDVFAPIADRLLDRARSLNRRLSEVLPPLQRLCLGIGRGDAPGDFRLAVRLQSQSALLDELVERVRAKVGGEMDVAFIGRVTPHIKKPLAKKPPKPAVAAKPVTPAKAPADDAGKVDPHDLQKLRRPLIVGCSVGHFETTAGTIGLLVRHRKTGRPVILSNSHVLALAGLAKLGDAVTQPGKLDGGVPADHVAALLDFVPLKTEGSNFVDAAIAVLDDSVAIDATSVPGIGAITFPSVEPIMPGQQVMKLGRTSGFTVGEIMATELDDVAVDYLDVGTVVFDDQIEIKGSPGKPFSRDGDSGSLIVNADRQAIGLLFAGNPDLNDGAGLSFANSLSKVIAALDLVTL